MSRWWQRAHVKEETTDRDSWLEEKEGGAEESVKFHLLQGVGEGTNGT